MLIKLDETRVLFSWRDRTAGQFRILDRRQNESWISFPEGAVPHSVWGDKLLLGGSAGVWFADVRNPRNVTPAKRSTVLPPRQHRDLTVFAGEAIHVVDVRGATFGTLPLNFAALQLADPGYSAPTEAVLLPGGEQAAVTIARSPHMAVIGLDTGDVQLVSLGPSWGNSNPCVQDGMLWVKNYDHICRIDPTTLHVTLSPRLQPSIRKAIHGEWFDTSAFIGEAAFTRRLDGWLVPRPYSGDILLVSPVTLKPIGRLASGGKPYAVSEWDDGELLILDHPFEVIRSAHVRDMTAV